MLDSVVNFVVYDLTGLSPTGQWGKAAHFFLYEVLFLSALLLAVVFTLSMVQSYLGADRIRRLLGSPRSPLAAVGGAMVGAVTPFCSCSAVPVFIGLVKAGAPAAGVFAFLTASPLINEIALVLIGGLFGWKTAVLYIGFGAGVAVLVGVSVERLNALGKIPTINTCTECGPRMDVTVLHPALPQRLRTSWRASLDTLRRMSPYLVIPLYSGTAVAAPIGFALTEKGVSIGTVVAFMMSVTALSLPEFVMLRTVLSFRVLVVFALIVAVSITGVGFLFNMILG
jgi:uncharacterized membrane protein YraQ (UPF0718 family)